MNIVEHFFIGWCVANTSTKLSERERMIVTAVAVIPDIDGLGMLVEMPSNSGGACRAIVSETAFPQSPPCATKRV